MRPANRGAVEQSSSLQQIVTIPLFREIFGQYLLTAGRGEIHYGVAMCFLPVDISLRAHAIEAICRVAEAQGLEVEARRDVPIQPRSSMAHVSQFILIPRDGLGHTKLEHYLDHVRIEMECELWSMGLTQDEALVLSCSSHIVTYAVPGGTSDPVACYPDLAYALQAYGVRDVDRPTSARS